MKRFGHPNKLIAFAFAAVLAGTATSALAEQTDTPAPNTSGYNGGYGPGMMNGYGPGYGPGMMGGYGQGYGPGMMNGYGPGYGRGMMNGYGPGYGPGMMNGYGPGYGPGMMGGYGPGYGRGMMNGYGPGYGQGMMNGYGPGYGRGMMNGYGPGYGPGMMNGYGPGYGPGMMNGYGPGYGPGMMGGYGPGYGPGFGFGARGGAARNPLSLSNDQRTKINAIQNQTRKSNWALMGQIQDEQAKIGELSEAPSPDNAAIEKAEKDISKLQQQMYQNAVDAHKKMDEVLTKEQKEKLRGYWQQ